KPSRPPVATTTSKPLECSRARCSRTCVSSSSMQSKTRWLVRTFEAPADSRILSGIAGPARLNPLDGAKKNIGGLAFGVVRITILQQLVGKTHIGREHDNGHCRLNFADVRGHF